MPAVLKVGYAVQWTTGTILIVHLFRAFVSVIMVQSRHALCIFLFWRQHVWTLSMSEYPQFLVLHVLHSRNFKDYYLCIEPLCSFRPNLFSGQSVMHMPTHR
jgi:hypothetical protein